MVQKRWVEVIDSHTEGEPTRVVIAGGPDLGTGDLSERVKRLQHEFDRFRSGVVCEPRGSEVVVGALLCEPIDPGSAAGVIFFNDVGYLGMCGHGTIGLITTLAHLGRIAPGEHRIETPVGTVSAHLHQDGRVSVSNVTSYRLRASVSVEVPWLRPLLRGHRLGRKLVLPNRRTPVRSIARQPRRARRRLDRHPVRSHRLQHYRRGWCCDRPRRILRSTQLTRQLLTKLCPLPWSVLRPLTLRHRNKCQNGLSLCRR